MHALRGRNAVEHQRDTATPPFAFPAKMHCQNALCTAHHSSREMSLHETRAHHEGVQEGRLDRCHPHFQWRSAELHDSLCAVVVSSPAMV